MHRTRRFLARPGASFSAARAFVSKMPGWPNRQKYSQMKLRMKREVLTKLNRQASKSGTVDFDTAARV
jgi:hypothetical protein